MMLRKLPPYSPDRYHPVVEYSGPFAVLDLTSSYDPDAIRRLGWAIGRYDEHRQSEMYVSDLFNAGRNHHMGIDIWAPAETPVYAFAEGVVYGTADNANPGDYGPTVVTEHETDGVLFWALWGHLSRRSLSLRTAGTRFAAGEVIGYMGDDDENGGWAPHLHFQLSVLPPHGVDMPGVVAHSERSAARHLYPDPRAVLGPVY